MEKTNKIRALAAFRPFFSLLEAYNPRHFVKIDWLCLVQNIGFTFGVTVLISLSPAIIVLAIWRLFERNYDLQNVVVAAPLIITILQMSIKMFILVKKHREVSEILEQLQRVIDQRTWFFFGFLVALVLDQITSFFVN